MRVICCLGNGRRMHLGAVTEAGRRAKHGTSFMIFTQSKRMQLPHFCSRTSIDSSKSPLIAAKCLTFCRNACLAPCMQPIWYHQPHRARYLYCFSETALIGLLQAPTSALQAISRLCQNRRERNGMCQAVLDLMRKGAEDARVEAILHMMDSFHISKDVALQYMNIPKDQRDVYRELVEKAKHAQDDPPPSLPGSAQSLPADLHRQERSGHRAVKMCRQRSCWPTWIGSSRWQSRRTLEHVPFPLYSPASTGIPNTANALIVIWL